ncbi:MAG TPA: precorrin-3B C(17)-methyltransferase [Nitrospirae bacterium]|nr:precorrin-3B C(17)-methyltransferase [Nitrospirota bacterium]
MTREVQRCTKALEAASSGRTAALICSGDPGIYAMAGLVFELARNRSASGMVPAIEVIPGVPALSASASRLGAPLMHDFAAISLSDRLTPWEEIDRRLHAAAGADFVIVIYNPRSRGRKDHLERAVGIISGYRRADTPVGIVKAATREDERIIVTALGSVPFEEVDMQSTIIVGNSRTFVWDGRMVTPRGYADKYEL